MDDNSYFSCACVIWWLRPHWVFLYFFFVLFCRYATVLPLLIMFFFHHHHHCSKLENDFRLLDVLLDIHIIMAILWFLFGDSTDSNVNENQTASATVAQKKNYYIHQNPHIYNTSKKNLALFPFFLLAQA